MRKFSIKMKIILWFALMLTFIVLFITSLTFGIANQVLDENIKDRLTSIVLQNVDEIEIVEDMTAIEKEPGDRYIEYNDHCLEIDDDFTSYFEGIYVGLFDSENRLLCGLSPAKLPSSLAFTFTDVGSTEVDGEKYYVFEFPVALGEQENTERSASGESPLDGLWIRGEISYKDGINVLYHVVRLSFWLLPVLALLAIFGGYIIAKRSFRPIGKIALAAEEIGSSGDLSKRLDIGEGRDELHDLADAFNGMFEKLEKNFEAEKQFTSNVSHELRTPTAVIMAQSEYALELADSEEEYREALETILRQSKQMNSMISQILFFSRLELGVQQVVYEKVDLSELTTHICQEQSMISGRDISLISEITPSVILDTDISLYSRLLNNLINNAYKYGKPSGHIWVTLHPEELIVRDDGIGISPENLEKIWNRFYQEDEARTMTGDNAKDESIGLGLSIVKEIVGLLGFRIRVESEPDVGTTFTITLHKD